MAISVGGGAKRPMSDINTTPLVDVMLVLLIIFLIAVPVAIQTVEELQLPIFASVESKDKVENLLITVTTTDAERAARRRSCDTGYLGRDAQRRSAGSSSTTPRRSIRRSSTTRRSSGSTRSCSAQAAPKRSCRTPRRSRRSTSAADMNAPWRCVAGTIYNVQAAGYPTVGFISNPVDPNG